MKPRAISFCVITRGPVACGVVSSKNFAAAPETGDTPGMAARRLFREPRAGIAGTTTQRATASTIDAQRHFGLRYFTRIHLQSEPPSKDLTVEALQITPLFPTLVLVSGVLRASAHQAQLRQIGDRKSTRLNSSHS